jgi:GNAT superfamily N-acetyltransferase
VHSLIIRQVLEEANRTFFFPRSLRLELLKNCPETIPILAQWIYDEWHSYDASLTKTKLILAFNERLNDDKIPITFVVLKDDEPISLISLKEETDPRFSDFPKGSIWLGSLQVAPEVRNQGIGQELFQFAAIIAKRMGYKEMYIYTSNADNVPWYEKRGTEIIEKRPFRNHTITIMHFPFK